MYLLIANIPSFWVSHQLGIYVHHSIHCSQHKGLIGIPKSPKLHLALSSLARAQNLAIEL